MGKRTKKIGPTRGLGARYGSTVRKRYTKIVASLKEANKCPQCSTVAVRRQSVGVWECKKCGFTFAGGAYAPITKLGVIARRTARGVQSEARLGEERTT
ncbi:50S ribosomal protein L37ae [Candidatus Bathyarchaeota archaeon]|nr:50S ribosomal protein L37ae [Candidatus Bathyarchaeota archaeon]NIV44727.1 50S ribosomal protein L37ae [Candidatus Bathyarchaeota archaeon]